MQRHAVSASVGLLVIVSALAAAQPRDWENPEVFERGRLPGRASFVPSEDLEAALRHQPERSPYYFSLNGSWHFFWAARPEETPAEFYRPDFSDLKWPSIRVPSSWQMEGFGHAKFRNVNQPFPSNPPLVPPEYNPVGSYRRTFLLPEDWTDRRILLHFEGVKSAAYVWVNGQPVGYTEGGMEPAEFDVTEQVQPGENLLAVQVFRFSDGTYLEDQDMWRLSGIHRDVYLVSFPQFHLWDFYVTTDLDDQYRDALLRVAFDLGNSGESAARGCVQMSLFEGDRFLFTEPCEPITISAGESASMTLERRVENPGKWSAEKPHLYTLVFELLSESGEVVQVSGARIGFREVEILEQQVLINGVPIKFNGVNSHMHHPETGRTVDRDTMRRDLILMKRFNVNLVRTSHYPPSPEYLDLADEIGIYVIDEANTEAHSTTYLSDRPEWREAYLDRGRRMVLRDRNHPSVIIWSAGNESGSGENICAIIEEGHRLDPSRPGWMYGGNNDYVGADPTAFNPTVCEDIVGPRYPIPRLLEELVARVPADEDPRPSFMDEYISVAGNGLGGLDEYWDLIWRYPRLTGGAIWDWVSPGITERVRLTPDASPRNNSGLLQGQARLVVGRYGNAVSLSGHDEWVEVYRDPALDLDDSDQVTLDFWVYPRLWNGHGWYVNKGREGYGIVLEENRRLIFYIRADERLEADLPAEWTMRWHRLSGVYDGREMRLYVDGRLAARKDASGTVGLSPFPVNIGRQADVIGQEHEGYLCDAAFDQVRIFGHALSEAELAGNPVPDEALLWLRFDEVEDRGKTFSLGIGARSYGLVWPDRRPQPELWQLKKSPQPVLIEREASKQIRLANRFGFTNLSELDGFWELHQDGEIIDEGALDVDLEPGGEAVVALPLQLPRQRPPGRDLQLLVGFRLKEGTGWAVAGHEVAWEQWSLSSEIPVEQVPPSSVATSLLTVTDSAESIEIRGAGFTYRLSRATGRLDSIRFQGTEMLRQGPAVSLFRAPVANEFERSWGSPEMGREWFTYGLDSLRRNVRSVESQSDATDEVVTVRLEVTTRHHGTRFEVTHVYRFRPDGMVALTQRVEPDGPMPPWLGKVGLEWELDRSLDRMSWYGRGPFETYPDRKTGARVGFFSARVDEMEVPYLIPQDYGNRTDVRWAAMSRPGGVGLLVTGDVHLNVSARPYSTDNLYRAEHPHQLIRRDGVIFNVDQVVAGVGCTAIKNLEPYRPVPQTYEFTIYFKPFQGGAAAAREIYRSLTP